MEPVQPEETIQKDEDHKDVSVPSWVSVCPRGLWRVQQKWAGERIQQAPSNSGDDTFCSSSCSPRLGSLCRVRVRLKADADESEAAVSEGLQEKLSVEDGVSAGGVTETASSGFPRCQDSVLQVPLDEWTTLRLGEGQCDVVEACLERMRAGEQCQVQLFPVPKEPDDSILQNSNGNRPLCATVELQSFTPGKESWEMSPGEKWEWVKSHKEKGGVRFRSGDVWGAADSYSRALKLLITLSSHFAEDKTKDREHEVDLHPDMNAADQERPLPSTVEFKTMKAELHSNMSLCQLKLNQPERAKASAALATGLDPRAAKAWYRLGQACQMVNELEEAKRAFRKLLELQPDFPAALKALKDIANREKETNAQLGLRLSKMFS